MRINSINSSLNTYKNYNSKPNNNNNNQPSIQFEGKDKDNSMLKGMKMATGALAASALMGGLGSCDKFNEDHNYIIKVPTDTVVKYVPIIMPPDTIREIQYDTIKVPVYIPGKDSIIYRDSIVHDTINKIITDTLWMKPEYDSPVAPIIKKFYKTLNINPGTGRIPVKMTWTDEKDGSYNKSIFNGKNSPVNIMSFNITKTPFDDEAGGVVIGKNEQYSRLEFSKVNDDALSLVYKVPRYAGQKPEDGREDQWRVSEYFLYDIKTDKVNRYKIEDNGTNTSRGRFEPGDMPSSIILVNPYEDKYRYSSVSVRSTDAPSKE